MKLPKIPNILDLIYPSRATIARYLHFCEKRASWVLGAAFLVTLLSVFGTIRLYQHVDTSLNALLPDYYRSVQTLNKIDQEGAKYAENIFIEGDDPDDLIDFADEIKVALEKDPTVHRVQVKRDIIEKRYAFLWLKRDQILSIRDRIKKRIARAKLKKSGFFISLDDEETSLPENEDLSLRDLKDEIPNILAKPGTHDEYFFSRDHKLIDIQVFPKKPSSDLAFSGQLYEVMKREVANLQAHHPKVKQAYYYGPYRKRLEEYVLIKHEANLIGWFTLTAVLLSVVLYFRQFFPVLVVAIPLVMGLFWTMGLTDLLIGKLNTMTAFLVGIITGLGVDFCIYLYSRYLEDRREGKERHEALVNTIAHTGRAAFTSGLNTSLVFMSLMLADFKGFSDFGFIAGMGLMLCYLAIYLLLPCLIILFEDRGFITFETKKSFYGIPWPKLPAFIPANMKRYPFVKSLIIFSVCIFMTFCFTFKNIEFEYDFGKLRSDLISYVAESELFERFNFGGPKGNTALLIMNSKEDIPAVRKAIEKKISEDTETPSLRGFVSLYDVWPTPEVQEANIATVQEIREMLHDKMIMRLKGKEKEEVEELKTFLNVEPFPLEDLPSSIINAFSPRQGPVGSYGFIQARFEIRTKDGRDAMRFADDAREVHTERGTFYASSQEIVFSDVLGLMLHESRLTVTIAILFIIFFVWLDFFNFRRTILVLIPLSLGVMLTLVLLHSFGGKITFYNMIVIPMIIGMGEDSAVHLFSRYLEEGRGSICKVMKTTGKAVWMASVTNILGFIGLAFSSHKGLQSIGFVAAAGIAGCLVCSLLVLPAIVQFIEDRNPSFPKGK